MSLNLSYNELTLIHQLINKEHTKTHNILGETDVSETKSKKYNLRYDILTSLQKTFEKAVDEKLHL